MARLLRIRRPVLVNVMAPMLRGAAFMAADSRRCSETGLHEEQSSEKQHEQTS